MVLLLGSAPPSRVRPYEQDGHLHDVWIDPGLVTASAGQPQAVQECPCQQGSLTLEAFSRIAVGGAFSVWDITGSVKLNSEVQALRRFIGYHNMYPRDPSQARVLLQVEMTLSHAGESERVTTAQLVFHNEIHRFQVWQERASTGGGTRLLLEGVVDIRELQSAPHRLILKDGEGSSEKTTTLDNIMIR
jgi:hypothetical protein